SKVEPIIVLSKIDLISEYELENIISKINNRIKNVLTLTVSNQTKGYIEVESLIRKGNTYCLMGSSGVGKSTLLNSLSGEEQMKTGEISSSVNKGRHITSHRELIVLKNGGILIDNPGMREVGIADSTKGLETTFKTIIELSKNCRFNDCTHTHERDCAVLDAVDNGKIDAKSYSNYIKIEKEKEHFESDAIERKRKDKEFGKMVKNVKKQRKLNKY
ncbi:MAG: ribosome small subunit-dependent GTPase A, partial [Bacteroidia bacterium]|nr:ribosome small subunit-dependent GTPase A [Bacteroidia bacterium]